MIKLTSLIQEIEYPLAGKDDRQSYQGYEGWKSKLVWMTPDKFLLLAAPLVYPSPEEFTDLEDKMKRGHPIDPLMLAIDPQRRKVIGHEGRHRAALAKKMGMGKVPVLIHVHIWDKRVPNWTKAQHDFVDKADFKSQSEF